MPLLSATTAGRADLLCLACGTESQIPRAQIRVHEEESRSFSLDCSACGATETFFWHDWVYHSARPAGNGKRGTEHFPDPDHDGARQMALIEKISRSLGLKHPQPVREKMDPPTPQDYPEPPRAPTQEEVREMVERIRSGRGR